MFSMYTHVYHLIFCSILTLQFYPTCEICEKFMHTKKYMFYRIIEAILKVYLLSFLVLVRLCIKNGIWHIRKTADLF